ncbi:hypothetical protein FRB91_007408 [Serendipita sp. 411]|nr:hypothetical protein FRC19_008145 [Serendipita sp. 401]KAG8838052.1 hypothetical protein FRC18_006637 [Serendipita sp. 400]KAG8851733.1 hypothetical protein FRB91_007408 [Serendipita sp. 411]
MQEIQHLLRLLNAPDVRRPTRAVFRSLLANCEDAKRLCSFVLESIRARVNERLQSEIVHRRRHHLPAIHMTEGQHAMLESEALNDEARRWMADFLLYPIGKRTRITRSSTRLLHKRTRHTQKSGSEDSATTARIQGEGIPETKGVLKRSGPHAPSTDVGGLAYEVKLFPKSDDPVRLSRFRVLVNVFHKGYQNALRNTNLASRSNTVLIDRRLLSMFDNGAFHLCCDDELIRAVPLWDEAAAVIAPGSPISGKSFLRPCNKSAFRGPAGPDKELVLLHALILQTWYNTGLARRLAADMDIVEKMPSIQQQVSVLGDSMFSQILQHRLALL